jgi:hypothetical protein
MPQEKMIYSRHKRSHWFFNFYGKSINEADRGGQDMLLLRLPREGKDGSRPYRVRGALSPSGAWRRVGTFCQHCLAHYCHSLRMQVSLPMLPQHERLRTLEPISKTPPVPRCERFCSGARRGEEIAAGAASPKSQHGAGVKRPQPDVGYEPISTHSASLLPPVPSGTVLSSLPCRQAG